MNKEKKYTSKIDLGEALANDLKELISKLKKEIQDISKTQGSIAKDEDKAMTVLIKLGALASQITPENASQADKALAEYSAEYESLQKQIEQKRNAILPKKEKLVQARRIFNTLVVRLAKKSGEEPLSYATKKGYI